MSEGNQELAEAFIADVLRPEGQDRLAEDGCAPVS